MFHPAWRLAVRRLAVSSARPRKSIALGRDTRLEDRLAPAALLASAAQRNWAPRAPLVHKIRQDPTPMLRAPDMPGLATLDVAIAGAVKRQWQVPVGTTTSQWVMGLAPGQDPQSVLGAGAQVTPTPYLPDTYVVQFPAPIAVAGAEAQFQGAAFYYPLVASRQSLRFIPNDPLFKNQWHLRNVGQTGGLAGADARVVPVWDNFTGVGVEIGIVDDGLEHTHPDLQPNYLAADSFDFNGNDPDPAPDPTVDWHGTSVAGVAAGRGNNGIGVSGAAPNASLAGLRLLGGNFSDQDTANALSYHRNSIDIYSNSWGPPDVGDLGSIGPLALAALQSNSAIGRNGLGNIYPWAAGNGNFNQDNVNYDPFANSRFVIAVGAVDHKGRQADYSEPGAPMLVTAYSNSFAAGAPGITTTDIAGANGYSTGDYTNDFGGTSSATPLVSGVIALMLQANPNLSNRDVQNILARTARKNDAGDPGWSTNAAGFHINHKYGFGAINAQAAVAMAQDWEPVKREISAQTPVVTVNRAIPEYPGAAVSSSVVLDKNIKLEHVEVVFNATHTYRGDLRVVLTAPSGTKSVLAAQHFTDSGDDYSDWVFTTVRDWGELSAGKWTLTVQDGAAQDIGTFDNWQLRVYGTEIPPTLSGLESTRLSVLENQSAAVTSSLTISDGDSPTMSGAKVFFTPGAFAPGEDQLTFTPQGGITGSYDDFSGTLTLFGSASIGQYQAALRSVRYRDTSDNPTSLVRTIAFRVTDNGGNASNIVTRTLTVVPVNDPPTFTAGPDVAVLEDSGPQTVTDWATDISGGPESGQFVSLEILGNDNPSLFSAGPFVTPAGTLLFRPAPDANGTANIQLRAHDSGGTANGGIDVSPTQSFRIDVLPVNDPAAARDDEYTLLEGGSLTVPASGVLANDRDPEGDALTAVKLTDPQHGTLTFNSSGALTYAPFDPNFSGNDTFTYRAVESGGGLSSFPATVTLHVAPTNDPPTANDDSAASDGHPVTINVLGNDTDPDGDVLRVGSYSRPTLGRLSRLGNSLVYTPFPGATGTDTFTYAAVDAAGVTDTATVTVDVTDAVVPELRSARASYGAGGTADLVTLGRSVLPWANVTPFEFTFSEGVTVDPAALTLTGALGGDVPLTFGYNAATRTATWSVAGGLAIDRYTLRLSAAGILDGSGNAVGGDWARAFAVLPGDFDGNGVVDDADLAGIQANFSRSGRPLNRWADINGSGFVDVSDFNGAAQNRGRRV